MEYSYDNWQRAWAEIYEASCEPGRRRWGILPGVAIMFHSVLDGMVRFQPGRIERILSTDRRLHEEVRERVGTLPDEITSPADLLVAFFESFRNGQALQRMIRSEAVFKWVSEHFGYDELTLGGTSANMAVTVASLGVPRVLVYANPLTKPLAQAFPSLPNLLTIGPDGTVGSPRDVAQGDDVFAIHWIFEYQKDDTIRIDGQTLTAPRANRFIPSWNPANNQLRLAPGFKATFLKDADRFSHLLVSGFHILSDRYPDGTTAQECIVPVADYLRLVRTRAPHMRVHCELASIAGKIVRKGVLDHILPQMDSIGLNEVELATWLEEIGAGELAGNVRDQNAPEAILAGLNRLADATGVPRIHLHNFGYYMVLAEKTAGSPEGIRQGLACGACAAVVRAKTGRPPKSDEVTSFVDLPLRAEAFDAMRTLAPSAKTPDFALTGVGTSGGRNLVFVPTRIVERPARTVGLGDTISASAWLAEGD
ncbi:MAG TPA: ADP-dependent glucokinase/phosphofructokinase [Candidatus Latescibacteria bacterium]|nr:ADP-dependent glucokinase/phosphofructokinase [Candidatus Latescibacterota bacterium]